MDNSKAQELEKNMHAVADQIRKGRRIRVMTSIKPIFADRADIEEEEDNDEEETDPELE